MNEILNIPQPAASGRTLVYKSGDRYGRLMLTGKGYYFSWSSKKVEYICDCGTIGWANLSNIRKGTTTSCGCFSKERFMKMITTHNLHEHPLYQIWAGVKDRCYNSNNPASKDYHDRGVTMCDEWRDDFKSFYDWAINHGWGKGLELDKDKLSPYKVGMIYSPEFCCFITRTENMRHRSVTLTLDHNGETRSLKEWCEMFNIKYTTAFSRYERGWTPKEILETPLSSKHINKCYR